MKLSIRFTLLVLLCIVSLSPSYQPVHAQNSGFDEVNVQRATVSITQMARSASGQLIISCSGSGTLVSANGLILTNAHIAQGDMRCKTDALAVGITPRIGEPPVPTYYADVVEINTGWDLAVLQIARTLDGRALDRSSLALPFVELGDSESLSLDDTVAVVGYPSRDDKFNGSVSIRRGTITSFTEEARVGSRAWIKTNASIPGPMTGGGAYDNQGKLIGVPTLERTAESKGTCRLVQDTNGDGRVDNQDTCVPSGGFVDALRPARLARGIVLAAQLGLTPGGASAEVPAAPASGKGTFDRLFFSPGVSDVGKPTRVVTQMPTGTKSLYLFFDYSNMADGMVYELRTTIDGVPNTTFSLAPSAWSGGPQGTWYIGSRDQIWPNGNYVFTLLLDGSRVGSASITLGGPAVNAPSFADILFGISDSAGKVIVTGTVLPAYSIINAEFVYNNIPQGATWRQVWFYEGKPITEGSAPIEWKDGADGKKRVSAGATDRGNLAPGRYRLDIYLNEQLAATSDFVMAGVPQVNRVNVFDTLSLTSEVPIITSSVEKEKTLYKVENAASSLANTIPMLYGALHWQSIAIGTPWTWRWSVDGNPLFESTRPWLGVPSDPFYWIKINALDHLPDGSYSLELLVEGISMAQATVKIGVGQLPVNTFISSSGVQLQGRIVDAETGKGIEGVMFIVLRSDMITREFTYNMADVNELALTDSAGQFQLTRLLPRNQGYNILVTARGYLPVATDGLRIDDNTKNPLILTIELNKD